MITLVSQTLGHADPKTTTVYAPGRPTAPAGILKDAIWLRSMSRRTTTVLRLNAEALTWLVAGFAMIALVAAILGQIGD